MPGPLWVLGRRTAHLVERAANWTAVLRQVRGQSANDQAILRRSIRTGLRRSLQRLDQWQDPVLLEDATVDVRGVGLFRVRAETDDLYHVLPYREQTLFEEIRRRILPGSTFIDAGANIGVFTVFAGRLAGPEGRVVAIEMIPETAARLRMHIELNRLTNVTLAEGALSSRSGQMVEAAVPEGHFGQASIMAGKSGKTITVETLTLDDVLASVEGSIDLIKIDVEGAEADALRGAGRVLERTRAIIFEQLSDDEEVADLLTRAGFTIRRLDASNLIAER